MQNWEKEMFESLNTQLQDIEYTIPRKFGNRKLTKAEYIKELMNMQRVKRMITRPTNN